MCKSWFEKRLETKSENARDTDGELERGNEQVITRNTREGNITKVIITY